MGGEERCSRPHNLSWGSFCFFVSTPHSQPPTLAGRTMPGIRRQVCVWKIRRTMRDGPCKTETKPSPGIYVKHKHLMMGLGSGGHPDRRTPELPGVK